MLVLPAIKKSDDNDFEAIARERFHDASFIGTDGEGDDHFWSIYHQAVVVSDGETVETVEFNNTPFSTLPEWLSYTERERGEWDKLLIADGGMVGMIDATVEIGA